MIRVIAVIPSAVCGIMDQIILHKCIRRIDWHNPIPGYVMYIVILNLYVAAAYPFTVACTLILRIRGTSAHQRTRCPHALHVNGFVADIVYLIAGYGQSVVTGFYDSRMVLPASGHYYDQPACCFFRS